MSQVLLIHCNGTDGSTTFTDSSVSAHTVTADGNAQVDTAQSQFGGASALFDGNVDKLEITGTLGDFNFGTGEFTIDFWIRFSSVSGDQNIFDFSNFGNVTPQCYCYFSGGSLI